VNNERVDEDLATPETPDYRTVTARPGDSISRLMGTARPEAIGRFVSLNGFKNSNLQAVRATASLPRMEMRRQKRSRLAVICCNPTTRGLRQLATRRRTKPKAISSPSG